MLVHFIEQFILYCVHERFVHKKKTLICVHQQGTISKSSICYSLQQMPKFITLIPTDDKLRSNVYTIKITTITHHCLNL